MVHGRRVGHELGFPTANIAVAGSDKMLPAPGVYALRATVNGEVHVAMANLGPQPTFHLDDIILEVHVLDFDGDLYGQSITIEFIERLRDIRQFESADALRRQLVTDKELAERVVRMSNH